MTAGLQCWACSSLRQCDRVLPGNSRCENHHVNCTHCCSCALQAPKSYMGPTDSDSDEDEGGKGKDVKKRASKRAAGSSCGSARQQLSGFEGCTHLFSDGDVYPSYQQGRCQAYHSGKATLDYCQCHCCQVACVISLCRCNTL